MLSSDGGPDVTPRFARGTTPAYTVIGVSAATYRLVSKAKVLAGPDLIVSGCV